MIDDRLRGSIGTMRIDGLRSLGERHRRQFFLQGPGPIFFARLLGGDGVASFCDHQVADHARYGRFAEADRALARIARS